MKAAFEIEDGRLVEAASATATVLIYSQPDAAETRELAELLPRDHQILESALDPDEISRVEITPGYTYIVWKRPNNAAVDELLRFEVSSVGLFLTQGTLIVILGERDNPFAGREFRGVTSPTEIILRFLSYTVRHFLGHLRVIKQLTRELESKLNTSQENQYLLQMVALGESLVYYLSAIEGNTSALSRLRANAERLGLSKEEIETMDGILIEHQQCARQTQIYSSVLSGLMDARGTIINNNINVLLKNLTLISVVFLPLNLIAGIGGMSEFTMMTSGVTWWIAYSLFAVALVVLGTITWFLLVKRAGKGSR